jgi:hypothetical protein
MTEEEWLECNDPLPMLEFLRGKTSDRKLRLFACACCRHRAVCRLLQKQSCVLLEIAERYADDHDVWDDLVLAAKAAPKGRSSGPGMGRKPVRVTLSSQAERAVLSLALVDAKEDAWQTSRWVLNLLGPAVCQFLRETVGNPFHPITLNPSWLTPKMKSLAQQIHDERAFDGLPILGDALEEAGCDNPEILAHCRGPGPHVRGCWVVDAVLGKE